MTSDTREQAAAWLDWIMRESVDLDMMAEAIFAKEGATREHRRSMLLSTCSDIISLGLEAMRERGADPGARRRERG